MTTARDADRSVQSRPLARSSHMTAALIGGTHAMHGARGSCIAAAVLLVGMTGCQIIHALALDARPCPCTTGWVCDIGRNVCIRPEPDVGDAGGTTDAALLLLNPSCLVLPPTCSLNGNDSCCTSPLVPGGTYFRDFDLAHDIQSGNMAAPAMISDFRLDKYEVTVGRFRAFVEAGMGTRASPPAQDDGAHAVIAHSGWDASWNGNLPHTAAELKTRLMCGPFATWTDQLDANENKPINCVTWYLAMAFCAWDGGYLPTEAEWNYAATGGSQQRAFAWSNPPASITIDRFYASYAVPIDGTSAPDCVGDGMPGCDATDLLNVGMLPAGNGRWGQSDLNGNVAEWALDLQPTRYKNPCVDCANIDPSLGKSRSIRGGSYTAFDYASRSSARDYNAGDAIADATGFRCARAP